MGAGAVLEKACRTSLGLLRPMISESNFLWGQSVLLRYDSQPLLFPSKLERTLFYVRDSRASRL